MISHMPFVIGLNIRYVLNDIYVCLFIVSKSIEKITV